MLTQKLFIATFSKKEQIITILLHWFAVISANFQCKLFRQDSRKDILLIIELTMFLFFFFNCIIIIVRCNCPKKNKDENGFVLEDEEKAVLGMLSSHASYKQVCH